MGALQRIQRAFNSLRAKFSSLQAKHQQTLATLREVEKEKKAQSKEILELRRRLAEHEAKEAEEEDEAPSREPPSWAKPNAPPTERKKPGAPEGHRGSSRPRPKNVDRKVEVFADECPECSHELGDPLEGVKVRFFVDIVPSSVANFMAIQHEYWCPRCRKKVLARCDLALPRKRIGINAAAFAASLQMQGVPYGRIRVIFEEMFGLKVTKRTLIAMVRWVKDTFLDVYAVLKQEVKKAELVNGDETSWRKDGKKNWLWVFRTFQTVLFVIRKTRGHTVPQEILGEDFDGTTVTDGWAAWFCKGIGGRKGLCYNHINQMLRKVEIKYGIRPRGYMELREPEFVRAGRPPAEFLAFAVRLREWLHDVAVFVKEEPSMKARRHALHGFRVRMGRLLAKGWKNKHAIRIAKFLRRHTDKLFVCVEVPGIPFHNNAAERALRPSVVNRKVSYGTKSDEGNEVHEVLRTITETQRLRGENPLRYFQRGLQIRATRGIPRN